MCREEAAGISSLKPQLDEMGIPLYAVIKENINHEVKEFRPYFKGEIFLDVNKCFYGPKQRKLGLMGFARLGVWKNFIRAWREGFTGNMAGEGLILGGVYVIGAKDQGILLEHREMEFGDKVDHQSLLEAVEKIKPLIRTKSEQ